MNKNILVTGGTGFIGSHTVVELINAGYTPIIVDNFSNSKPEVLKNIEAIVHKKIVFYRGDFQDIKLLTTIIKEHPLAGIIHFAAYKAVGESVDQPLKYYANNVAGLVDLLKAAGNKKLDFVFSSSCTVYGEPDSLPIPETAPLKPAASPYGATKQMCETILQDATAANKKLRSISLRYFNPIGAHPSGLIGELPIGIPANLIPFVTQTAAGLRGELTVYGDNYKTPDGTCIRDYIHVVDLAKAHVKALQHLDKQKSSYYDFFNIGTGKGNSVLEVIQTFERATGQKVPYKIGARRPGDVMASYADAAKAHSVLGWQAEFSLSDALKDAWRWQQTL